MSREQTRDRIVGVAAELLRAEGPGAVTTRRVAEAAGVQAPAIYRLFGDKDGLLDAVAEHVFAAYAAGKRLGPGDDPVADLRAGWDLHVEFGLANPGLAVLLAEPGRAARSPAIAAGVEVLRERVRRVAATGRLAVAEDRAVALIHAAGTGTVLALLADPRDPGLADAAFEAVAAAILTDAPRRTTRGAVPAAVALRAGLDGLEALSEAERALLGDWLDRIVDAD